ncbi:MAG: hypothetical protein AAFO83_13240, partial [Cyanobacteria bacterium J06607_13]
CRESQQPFLPAAPTALSLEAAADHPTSRAWFDEYGTARSLPTIRVTLAPTAWQKATAVLLSLVCILLILNLIATVLGLSSNCSRRSSRCPQPISLSSAEPPTQ